LPIGGQFSVAVDMMETLRPATLAISEDKAPARQVGREGWLRNPARTFGST